MEGDSAAAPAAPDAFMAPKMCVVPNEEVPNEERRRVGLLSLGFDGGSSNEAADAAEATEVADAAEANNAVSVDAAVAAASAVVRDAAAACEVGAEPSEA